MDTTERAPRRVGRARWIAAEPADRANLRREHPEAFLTTERLADLMPAISRRAAALDRRRDPDVIADLRSDLVLRVIEGGQSSRERDENGQPVYDYLAQRPDYIALHASTPLRNRLRRERAFAKTHHLASLDTIAALDRTDERVPFQVIDIKAGHPAEDLVARELLAAVVARVSRAQRRVLALLVEGRDRSDIATELGLSRKTVHDHMQAIRLAVLAVLADDPSAFAEVRRRYGHGRSSVMASALAGGPESLPAA